MRRLLQPSPEVINAYPFLKWTREISLKIVFTIVSDTDKKKNRIIISTTFSSITLIKFSVMFRYGMKQYTDFFTRLIDVQSGKVNYT